MCKVVDLSCFMFGLTIRAIKVFKSKKQFTITLVRTQPRNHGGT
jgi:hypothetical protein